MDKKSTISISIYNSSLLYLTRSFESIMNNSHFLISRAQQSTVQRGLSQLQTLHIDPIPREEEVPLGDRMDLVSVIIHAPHTHPKVTVNEGQEELLCCRSGSTGLR